MILYKINYREIYVILLFRGYARYKQLESFWLGVKKINGKWQRLDRFTFEFNIL